MKSPSELSIVVRPGAPIRRPSRATLAKAELPDLPARFMEKETAKTGEARIFVRGLMIEAEVGVYSHEKGARRPLVVDIDVWIVAPQRFNSDELAETVDYDSLVAHARAVVADAHIHLIETIAERIADRCLNDARVVRARIKIEKPGAVLGAACSGVEVERART